MKIGLLGLGRYRSSLIEGIILAGNIKKKDLTIYDEDNKKVRQFLIKYPQTKVTKSQEELVLSSQVIIVGHLTDTLDNLLMSTNKSIIKSLSKKIFISMDALIGHPNPNKYQIIHLLNNYATKVLSGITAVYLPKELKDKRKTKMILNKLLKNTGSVFYVKELKDILKFRIAAGSGIGLLAFFIGCLKKVYLNMGYGSKTSKEILSHVVQGVDRLIKSGMTEEELVKIVVTKGGPTELLLAVLKNLQIDHRLSIEVSKILKSKSLYNQKLR